jgi:sigma-B regulation protein RsbU (phosphoserine phosphatase)
MSVKPEFQNWRKRLDFIVETMKQMSLHTEPQAMVRDYGQRMRELLSNDGFIAVSRRDLATPKYRITRSNLWEREVNPWKEKHLLPVLEGGVLGRVLYSNEPSIIEDFQVDAHDPAADHLKTARCLAAIPNYDQGESLNMTVLKWDRPRAVGLEQFPELVWMGNLFGRATQNLVLSEQLREAYEIVDHELRTVAEIQESLLPAELPEIPSLELDVHYQTSHRAGGDYYDFFRLPDGRLGMLIADASGHGTPAAVVMAITHSLAHAYPASPEDPAEFLSHLNGHLARRRQTQSHSFVTAFYGVFDPRGRELRYASAGHEPPRWRSVDGERVVPIDDAQSLPLGVIDDETYKERMIRLQAGDQLTLYTDGITETQNTGGDFFGYEGLDDALRLSNGAPRSMIDQVIDAIGRFSDDAPAHDDRTIIAAVLR